MGKGGQQSKSHHHCWALKRYGCNKSKEECSEHYSKCYGEGTRTHDEKKVPTGSRCESFCRDTSDDQLYTCGIKCTRTCLPLNLSSAIIFSLIYSFQNDSVKTRILKQLPFYNSYFVPNLTIFLPFTFKFKLLFLLLRVYSSLYYYFHRTLSSFTLRHDILPFLSGCTV